MWEQLLDEAWWRFLFTRATKEFIADLPWLLLAVGAWSAFALYALKPILLRKSFRQSFDPQLRLFDPLASPPPHDVAAFFESTVKELETLGFSVAAHLCHTADTIGFYAVLLHEQEKCVALVYSIQSVSPSRRMQRRGAEQSIGFETRFTDGQEVGTTNNRGVPGVRIPPHIHLQQFPEIKSPALLWQLHRRRVQEFGGNPKRFLPLPESVVQWLRNEFEAAAACQTATGYLFRERSGEYYRLTWKGAFLLTWMELWPVSAVRRLRQRRRTARLLTQWKFDEQSA